jgi:hypothetical protein
MAKMGGLQIYRHLVKALSCHQRLAAVPAEFDQIEP